MEKIDLNKAAENLLDRFAVDQDAYIDEHPVNYKNRKSAEEAHRRSQEAQKRNLGPITPIK